MISIIKVSPNLEDLIKIKVGALYRLEKGSKTDRNEGTHPSLNSLTAILVLWKLNLSWLLKKGSLSVISIHNFHWVCCSHFHSLLLPSLSFPVLFKGRFLLIAGKMVFYYPFLFFSFYIILVSAHWDLSMSISPIHIRMFSLYITTE